MFVVDVVVVVVVAVVVVVSSNLMSQFFFHIILIVFCTLYTIPLEPATEYMKSRQISNPLARWWQWQQRGSRTRNETSEGGRVVKNYGQ